MLKDKDGRVMDSHRIQALRRRQVDIPAAIYLVKKDRTCDAKKIDPSNFLLPDNRCCYCGLPQDVHR